MAEHDHADPEREGQIHHFELYTDDYEAVLPFWDWLLGELGYEPKDDWHGGSSWQNSGTYVVLCETEKSGEFDRNSPGLNHVAFHAGSHEQVDRLSQAVQERSDTTLLYPDEHPYAGGYYALYCESPDGLKVEVVGPSV